MEEKQKFVCSYCGAEYDDAPARARCELECDEKRKQEAARRRREELMRLRNERLSEIKKKYDALERDVRSYGNDYDLQDLVPIMKASRFYRSPFWLLWS